MNFLMKLSAIKLLIFAFIAPIGAMDEKPLSTPEKIALKRRLIKEQKERKAAAQLQPKVEATIKSKESQLSQALEIDRIYAQSDTTNSNLISIDQLKSMQTAGKVRVWCNSKSNLFIEDLDFPNIGHLELFVHGPLTTHYSLKAPILTLHVDGPLALGKDNEHLSAIAATDGELTIDAHSIDGRYGKFYGKGKTLLESTKSDIAIGAEARGVDENIKQQFMESAPLTRTGWGFGAARRTISVIPAGFDYSLDIMNGAYAASGDQLILKSAANIFIKFGEVNGTLGSCLIAPNEIQNLSGRISSKGPIAIQATEYNHVRKGAVIKSACHVYWYEYPGSGPAVLESLGGIDFQVKNIRNVAGSMRSGQNIFINKMALSKETGYIEEPQTFIYTVSDHYAWHKLVLNTQSCTTQSGGDIQMNLGNFVITGSMSAPGKISIHGNTGLFANTSRSRSTQNPTQPLIADVIDFLEEQAQKPGMLKKGANNCFETEFPLGSPSRPQEGDVVLLENPQTHTPLWKEIFNPLGSINLDLYLQHLIGNLAGRVHAGKAKGNNLSTMLWANANRWRQLHNKDVMSQADLQNITQSMLLTQIVFNGATAQQQTLLCIAPQDVNPYQDQGDMVAGEIEVTGEQAHQNNRLVANGPEGITLTSPGDINLETQKYTVPHETKEQRVVQELAYPQQQLLAPAGPINVTAHKNITRTGTAMAAGTLANARAQTGSVVKNPLVLQTFVENRSEESDGWFSSTETIETSLTHQAIPSTTMAGIKLQDKAADSIQSVASQDSAGQEIVYEAPHTNIEGLLVADRATKHTQKDGMFTQQESSESKETPYGIPATIQAPLVRFVGEDARVNAHIQAHELRDETEKGIKFVAKVAQMLCSGQTLVDSPMMSIDAGYKAGYETMIPPMLMVEKIVRAKESGHMVFESAVMDKDRTEIIGKFVETTYHLKQWQTSWCHKSQVVPNEALVVVAFAIAVGTQGMGVKFLTSMLKSVTAATGMQLSAAGIAAVNAGFTTICSSAGTSLLRTGDPIQTAEQLGSPAQLKSLVFNMASAGLCSQLGNMLDVNMVPGAKPFVAHVQEKTLRSTVNTLLNIAINDVPVDRALSSDLKQASINAVAAYAANQICTAYMDTVSKKAMQTVVGGLSGFAMQNNRDGLIAGATGALTAEVVGEALIADAHAISDAAITKLKAAGKPLTPANIQQAIQHEVHAKLELAKIAAGGAAVLLRQDPNMAMAAAANAIDNDVAIRGSIYVFEEFAALLNAASQAIANLEAHMEPAQEAPVKRLKPKRKPQAVKNNAQDEAARDLALQLIQRPQDTYADLILEHAQEVQIAKPKREKPRLADVAGEIIREAATEAVNKTVDLYSMVPNPIGIACFAAGASRDIYQGRKTAGEMVFDTALGYGALKGIQWTGRGIKFLYQSGKNLMMKMPESIQLAGENLKLLYQNGKHITIKMNDKMLDTLHQLRYKASGRVPFVENPQKGRWLGGNVSGELILDPTARSYPVLRKQWKYDEKAPFLVFGHGNSSVIQIDNALIHPKGLSQANLAVLKKYGKVQLNAVQICRLIRTAPGYKLGQHAHFHSCSTGADKNGIAKQVADRMGVPVSAFNKTLWNGERSFWTTNSEAHPITLIGRIPRQLGVLKTFYPNSGIKKSLIPLAAVPLALLSADESQSPPNISKLLQAAELHREQDFNHADDSGRKPFVEDPKAGRWESACISGDLLLSKDNKCYEIIRDKWQRDPKCPFNVVGHGNQWAVTVDAQNIHPHGLDGADAYELKTKGEVSLFAKKLYKLIKADPNYKGQHINMFVCKAGAYDEGIAQQLADEAGVPVSAFTGDALCKAWSIDLDAIVKDDLFDGKVIQNGFFASIADADAENPQFKEIKTFHPREKTITNIPGIRGHWPRGSINE